MHERNFRQVDVFTAQPWLGNPLAVVMDGSGLSDAQMQQFAAWTNLSETSFILPASRAGVDYRLRIFTPGGELPFAGHPTLGSCHAWLEAAGPAGQRDVIVQECAVGLVKIRRDGLRLAFEAPPLRRAPPDPATLKQVAQALGLEAAAIVSAQVLDNGPVWLGLLLDSPGTVLGLEPDHAALKGLGVKVGVAACYGEGGGQDGVALEVRAFAAPVGINEDPVTGSLNASLAQWLIGQGKLSASYVAAQGQRLGRAGRIHIASMGNTGADELQVWVGGQSVTCISGTVKL